MMLLQQQQQGGKSSKKIAAKASMGGVTTNSSLLILVFLISLFSCLQRTICCVQAERLSLLHFKAGLLHDPYNTLASWVGQDCCQWERVECSNRTTGHVISLNLLQASLGGQIRPSLLGLKHLTELDLAGNNFQGCVLLTNRRIVHIFIGDQGEASSSMFPLVYLAVHLEWFPLRGDLHTRGNTL